MELDTKQDRSLSRSFKRGTPPLNTGHGTGSKNYVVCFLTGGIELLRLHRSCSFQKMRKWLWVYTLRVFTYLSDGSHYPLNSLSPNSDNCVMFTFYLQAVGVSKQNPVRWQNSAGKWLVQKHCDVAGNLLLIRQWDYIHLSIACSTNMKHKKASFSNKNNKEAEEPSSAKAEQSQYLSWWLGPRKRHSERKNKRTPN